MGYDLIRTHGVMNAENPILEKVLEEILEEHIPLLKDMLNKDASIPVVQNKSTSFPELASSQDESPISSTRQKPTPVVAQHWRPKSEATRTETTSGSDSRYLRAASKINVNSVSNNSVSNNFVSNNSVSNNIVSNNTVSNNSVLDDSVSDDSENSTNTSDKFFSPKEPFQPSMHGELYTGILVHPHLPGSVHYIEGNYPKFAFIQFDENEFENIYCNIQYDKEYHWHECVTFKVIYNPENASGFQFFAKILGPELDM